MPTLFASFHGGSVANAINSILSISPSSPPSVMLSPNTAGVMPALSELRGFTTDAAGTLYVVNAYKNFSQILTFSKPAVPGGPFTYASVFIGGKDSELAHPFCAAFGSDGHLYVSNQDPNSKGSIAVTYYEGPTMKHPGRLKGIFADGFTALRGIATNGTLWYVADAGDSKTAGSVSIFDASGKKQTSLSVHQPVHLLYDGSKYLYIGSEKDNAVYQFDTTGSGTSVTPFIESSPTVGIDHTSGLAIVDDVFYVASRIGMSINQYSLTQPSSGSVFISGLADNPEFIATL
jgi:hypothetical protein